MHIDSDTPTRRFSCNWLYATIAVPLMARETCVTSSCKTVAVTVRDYTKKTRCLKCPRKPKPSFKIMPCRTRHLRMRPCIMLCSARSCPVQKSPSSPNELFSASSVSTALPIVMSYSMGMSNVAKSMQHRTDRACQLCLCNILDHCHFYWLVKAILHWSVFDPHLGHSVFPVPVLRL